MKFVRAVIFAALFYASGAAAQFSPGCGAGFCGNNGSGGGTPVVPFLESERSVWNLDTGGTGGPDFIYDYAFINHVQVGNFQPVSPGSYASPNFVWASGNPVWNRDVIDPATGYVNAAGISGNQVFGGHLLIPASSNYATYVLTWSGQGNLSLSAGTWTTTNITGTGCVTNSNGNWTGTGCRVEVTYSGAQTQIGWRVNTTNPSSGGYLNNFKFFRAADEADLLAGKVYRTPWKQKLVELNPSAIRAMNWLGGNSSFQMRWETRLPPTYAAYSGGSFTNGPPYPQSGESAENVLTVGSAAGMPVTMQHGEVVTTRMGTSMVRSGNKTVSAIAKCDPATTCTCTGSATDQVTATAHGFLTGDTVVFVISAGMVELSYWDSTITVCDANHFNTTINTTSFATFTAGTVSEQVYLQVGGRGFYPIIDNLGAPIASEGSNNFLHANDYRTFFFDKSMSASRNGGGTQILGAWVVKGTNSSGSPATVGADLGVPVELIVKLINEIDAMYVAQGFGGPTHLWLNVGAPALLSMDPDYSVASNPAIQSVYVALNGANGYAGLPARSGVLLEYNNETWNCCSASFTQAAYIARRGVVVNPVATPANYSYYSAVRSAVMAQDVRGFFGSNTRIKLVQATKACCGPTDTPSAGRINGSALYYVDPTVATFAKPVVTGTTTNTSPNITLTSTTGLVECSGITGTNVPPGTSTSSVQLHITGPTTGTLQSNCGSFPANVNATGTGAATFTITPTPQSYHDYFAYAPYLDLTASYVQTFSTGLRNDTAMYWGTDNSGTLSMTGGTGGVPSTALVTTAVAAGTPVVRQILVGTGITAGTYVTAVAGSSPNYTLTLNQNATVTAGTTITAPANGGGNFVGAANPTQALVNFVANLTGGGGAIPEYYGYAQSYDTTLGALGQKAIQYEGGTNWPVAVSTYFSTALTPNEAAFMAAAQGSTQWATAFVTATNAYSALSSTIMPAIYAGVFARWGHVSVNALNSPSPDTYSGGVEGAAWNAEWTQLGTRNAGIP